MKFKIEQIAICPKSPEQAKKLLEEMGAGEWAEDHVVAEGEVFGSPGRNEANLSFNYDLVDGKEFEVLHYTTGKNWMGDREAENDWPREVNPVIAGKRTYNYVIFDTKKILGVDVKFIVRINNDSVRS